MQKILGVEMKNMVVTIKTEQKLEARFIKIRVENWHLGANLKLEFYGCDKGNTYLVDCTSQSGNLVLTTGLKT